MRHTKQEITRHTPGPVAASLVKIMYMIVVDVEGIGN